jgi:nucleotide-binding universal stress UspA family protein
MEEMQPGPAPASGWFKVLLASDGSPGALAAADWVRRQLVAPDTWVTVVVVETLPTTETYAVGLAPVVPVADPHVDPETEAAQAMERTLTHLEGAGRISQRIVIGKPVDRILEAIAEERPDLVVVGRRGLSRLESFFLGSVSSQVVAKSPVPVLVIPYRGPS